MQGTYPTQDKIVSGTKSILVLKNSRKGKSTLNQKISLKAKEKGNQRGFTMSRTFPVKVQSATTKIFKLCTHNWIALHYCILLYYSILRCNFKPRCVL